MRDIMRTVFFGVLMMLAGCAYAEDIFPVGCVPFVVIGPQLSLPSGPPRVVMLHNLSDGDLWLTHQPDKHHASAGWSSHLQSEHWSALSLMQHAFTLQCIESKPGHEQPVDCSAVLAVCQWPRSRLPQDITTVTHWASENMLLSPLMAYIERRGFVLSD
jgi:hypothetical protein